MQHVLSAGVNRVEAMMKMLRCWLRRWLRRMGMAVQMESRDCEFAKAPEKV